MFTHTSQKQRYVCGQCMNVFKSQTALTTHAKQAGPCSIHASSTSQRTNGTSRYSYPAGYPGAWCLMYKTFINVYCPFAVVDTYCTQYILCPMLGLFFLTSFNKITNGSTASFHPIPRLVCAVAVDRLQEMWFSAVRIRVFQERLMRLVSARSRVNAWRRHQSCGGCRSTDTSS